MRYALIDTANTYFRSRHIASKNDDPWLKVGMCLHLTLASVNQVVRNYKIDHVVFCLEGTSWRKKIYEPYKKNRVLDQMTLTQEEKDENKLFWETYEKFTTYLIDKTNVSVVRHEFAEADDLIARFIDLHPNDTHYIISTDSDYIQLISPNVFQYNGITNQLITPQGYFSDSGKQIVDKKTKKPKSLEADPEYLLFRKIIRGDPGDNVFSAYPRASEKGSKNRVGILEAYTDRNTQGFKWNNFMLQRWVDHNGVEHRVREDYETNRMLIDLRAQPLDIKSAIDQRIKESVVSKKIPQVGIHFMKFCGKYELNKISEQADAYAKWLNAPYQGVFAI